MPRRYRSLVLLFFLLASCSSVPPTGKPTSPDTGRSALDKLHSQIDTILADSTLLPCFIGVKIVSLKDGTVLYERNGNKLFHPASNMKLLTTAAGLRILGKDFKFRTVLTADSVVRRGELRGSLYVRGFGDPLTMISDIDSLARIVRSHGIERVRGGIVGNTSYFDTLSWGAGWMWDDEPDPDEAFISALNVNDNAIEVSVRPGRRIGEPVEVTLNPPTAFVNVLNSGVTSRDTLIQHVRVTRRRGENTIVIEGRMDPHAPQEQFTLSVWKPELYFLSLFKERLAEAGVKVRGPVRLDTLAGTLELAELLHPIDSILHKVNKPSDNLAAESLLKAIAAE
ncbi:MAG: D-alanyl-D-alanine carboxypeptidase/D-alanyl-D-alanine-endopeptidase, partial [Ignavibacteria bacterium]